MIFHNFFRPKKFPSIPSFVECFIIRSFWILYIVFFRDIFIWFNIKLRLLIFVEVFMKDWH